MLYWLVTAMYPQFLITLDENDEEQDVTVRVGQAVNTVGLAGTRSGISGVSPLFFQFPFFFPHTSPSSSTSPHLLRSWVSTHLYLISLHLRFTSSSYIPRLICAIPLFDCSPLTPVPNAPNPRPNRYW
jgi:hypothetical protein